MKSSKLIYLVLMTCLLALSACRLEEIRIEPSKSASIFAYKQHEQFGVCWPFELDRRGTRLNAWDQMLFHSNDRPPYNGIDLLGYEVGITRGQSCHLRIVDGFQTAMQFDLTALPEGAVTSAELLLSTVVHGGLDPVHGFGTAEQCETLIIGTALEPWDDGYFGITGRFTLPSGETRSYATHPARPLINTRPIRMRSGPHRRLASGINVTREVMDWVAGRRENNGFTITPNWDLVHANYKATDNRGYQCPMWITGAELVVTVSVPDE